MKLTAKNIFLLVLMLAAAALGAALRPHISMIDKLYSQTLSRSYTNAQGYRIMLSINTEHPNRTNAT